MATLSFTQAQGGDKKESMTYDHLFIIYALMDLGKYLGVRYILTFFDVKQAYDLAHQQDLLCTLWDGGIHGKAWRLTKKMNENLSAKVNTRFGMS